MRTAIPKRPFSAHSKIPSSHWCRTKQQATFSAVDVHALHKSATMFLFSFFRRLAEKQQFEFYSENSAPPNPDGPAPSNLTSFCRCPIRTFETSEFKASYPFDHYRIFHVRDPRDVLVSEYFSLAWIHPTNGTKLKQRRELLQDVTVDEYVLNQSTNSNWPLEAKYVPLLNRELDPGLDRVVTYEEMVTDFPSWVEKVIPAFGFRFPKIAAYKLAWHYRNEFAVQESMKHKRKITPGDHREKLAPATIDVLNQRFEPVLKRFGYLK